jgi:cyclopropane fatty-acyl-phospholipid synthase-like methyltransferase
MQFIQNNPPGYALDLGCGTGTNAITMASNGWRVTGIDFVPRAIRRGKQNARIANVEVNFRVEDVTQLHDLTGPYDLILDIGCLHNLPVQVTQKYIRNVIRLLAQGGTYLLYAFLSSEAGTQPGITLEHIQSFSHALKLINRQDSTDRMERPSVWLTFIKPEESPRH